MNSANSCIPLPRNDCFKPAEHTLSLDKKKAEPISSPTFHKDCATFSKPPAFVESEELLIVQRRC
jgi:hypothetical protein